MLSMKFARLFGKSWSRKRARRMLVTKRFTRPLGFLCLEDRRLLAGILASAQDFAVLGHTTVTNTGPTVIFGSAATLANTGVFNAGGANATTGFSSAGNTFVGPGSNTDGPGLVDAPAAIHLGSPVANLARNDLISAFTVLAAYGTATNLTGHDLGTSGTLPIGTLVAGVYSFDTTAQLNGLLQLDAQGTNGGVWVFQIGSTLTTASASSVQLINPGGNLGADVGVYWVVGSSATLGTTTAFEGNILAQTSITLNTGATIYNGRALAIDGAVTLDTNTISDICPPASSSPNSGPGFSLGGLGSLAWEKRDASGTLLGGAQFTISPDPTDGVGILTILDNGPGDADPALGQILVNNALLGTYTVTETVAPLGYVIDADPTRVISVTVSELNPVIGVQGTDNAGVTDESDFHNSVIQVTVGSIAWEKRDAGGVLLGGAQFTISPDPTDGVGILTILDNGPGDADPALGQILVLNALPGTYTITETVAPLGYVIDADPTRVVTVTVGDLTQVVGVQGTDDAGVTDESDFHNSLIQVIVGSIAWEKRDASGTLLGGAQFTISPDPTDGVGILTILDNGPGDADPALGQILVLNALPGTYTITETVAPLGYVIDADPTRVVTVTVGDLTQVIGVQGFNDPGVTDESDFHNSLIQVTVGSIAWEKRSTGGALLVGAQFTITPDPIDGVGILTILDNGPGDADPAPGQILVLNALPGTYTITETVAPLGYVIDADPTRVVTVTVGDLTQVIGVQGFNDPGVTDESDFHNRLHNVIVIGPGKSPLVPEFVRVIDEGSGALLAQFAPYGNTFQGGVRVATGDLTGDGVDEIVTAPGWSIVAEVRVYTQNGGLLTSFRPYSASFDGGVQVAVGDVDGDGLSDIITVPSWGPAEVKVFRNVLVGGAPTFDASNPYRDFLAFPTSFIGGAVVDAADMGKLVGSSFVNTLDGKAEIVVGSGAGIKTTVKVFDVSGAPTAVRSFTPFSTTTTSYQGGVSLSLARINADLVPDIVVGAGVNGRSLVDVWAWSNTPAATLSSLSANGIGFAAFTDASRNSPVQVATLDTDGDDIADVILAVQGPGGTTSQIREFNITSVAPLQVSPATAIPGSFLGPYFIATISPQLTAVPVIPFAAGPGVPPAGEFDPPLASLTLSGGDTNLENPLDVNNDGQVSPVDVLLVINRLNSGTTLSHPLFGQSPFLDINNDGNVSPVDALLIINWLNRQSALSTQNPSVGQAEGEASTAASDAYFNQVGSVAVELTGDYQSRRGTKWSRRME